MYALFYVVTLYPITEGVGASAGGGGGGEANRNYAFSMFTLLIRDSRKFLNALLLLREGVPR